MQPHFGARLRLAVDVMNALCACDGFCPSQNPRFWRRAFRELEWRDAWTRSTNGPFDGATCFANYAVVVRVDHSQHWGGTMVRQLITGGSGDVGTEVIRNARARVRQTLRGFATRSVRKLTFLFCLEGWNIGVGRWYNIRQAEDGHLALASEFVDSAIELMELQRQQQEEEQEETNVGFSMATPAVGVETLQLSLSFQMDALQYKDVGPLLLSALVLALALVAFWWCWWPSGTMCRRSMEQCSSSSAHAVVSGSMLLWLVAKRKLRNDREVINSLFGSRDDGLRLNERR